MIEILRGISGSGKSTYAAEKEKEGAVIICRDRIRTSLLGEEGLVKYFSNGMDWNLEQEVTTIENQMLVSAIKKGEYVIIDNTHLKKKYIQSLVNIFYDLNVPIKEVKIKTFDVGLAEARKRVSKRDSSPISEEVHQSQWSQFISYTPFLENFIDGFHWKVSKSYEKKKWHSPSFKINKVTPDTNLPDAVICDLDGTLAHRAIISKNEPRLRSFYDYQNVETDSVDDGVLYMLKALEKTGTLILFVTGRKETAKEGSLEFLRKAGFENPILFTRNSQIDISNGVDSPDDQVKYRLFNTYIRDRYNVRGVFDDRARVVAMWQELGLKTFICAPINELGTF